jgi:aspartokinase
VGIQGWTEVFVGDRVHADIVAAALAARGLRAEVLAGRVLVPDEEAKLARQVVDEAEPVRPEPDIPEP